MTLLEIHPAANRRNVRFLKVTLFLKLWLLILGIFPASAQPSADLRPAVTPWQRYYDSASIHLDSGQFQRAYDLYEQCLSSRNNIGDSLLALIGNYQGICADETQRHKLASQCYFTAIAYARKCADSLILLSEIYTNAGILHTKTGNLDFAFFYQKKALEIDEMMVPVNPEWVESDKYNLARTIRLLGDHRGEIKLLNQVLSERLKRNADPVSLANVYINLSVAHRQLGETDLALQYIQLARENDSKMDHNTQLLWNNYYNECLVYLHTGEGRKALQSIGKMQEFTASGATEDPGTMSLLRARAYQLINDRNLARQNFLHAHSFWLESLAKNVEGVMNKYLETVYHYAMFLEQSDPDATYTILRNALDLLRVSRYSAENLDSYERLYTNHGKLFEFAARFFHRLFEDTNNEIYRLRLMQLIEDHHQAALNRDYLKYQVKSELIPDSMQLISQRILKLKAHIAFAQQELTASNKDTLQQLNARLNDLYLNWHRQVATIPHEQFSTSNSLIEQIDSVRRWCNQWKESILSYYLTDSSVFINLINADTFLVIRKDIPATEISRQVRQMVESITAYRHSQLQEEQLFKSQISTFRSTSNALYLTLIQPVEKLLEQRVTIIPDGVLFDLPYACLTQESPGREAWDFPVFLVESHDFSFNYSLHSVTRASTTQADAGMVCIAPFTEPNPENSENYLPGSAKELELLQSIMEVRYLSPELHKEQVVKALEKKSIIHISSHALAEFGHPSGYYLCINKYPEEFHGRLYLDEIYHLQLKSDLIILNACQTAKSDQGAISISRAFFLAGTKHVISTLWHIPDQHSRLLSKQMYQSLEFQGHVGASLAEAQRTYLKTHQGMELHPYHWNGYVAWGNGKIQIDTTRSGLRSATTWLTLGTLLLLMFISWLVLKKKRVVQ